MKNVMSTIYGTYANGSPANGELWYDGTDFCFRTGGITYKLPSLTGNRIQMTGDQTLAANSSTFVDITELVCAVAANSQYEIDLLINRVDAGGANTKFSATFPTGGNLRIHNSGTTSTEFASGANWSSGNLFIVGGTSYSRAKVLLTTAGTAGNFQMRAAQSTSEATAHVLKKGSYILPKRLY